MNIEKYNEIKSFCLQNNIKLVAVSKTKPKEDISLLYKENQRVFGENKVQELVDKYNDLPKDIEWHFIGHLQKNKVKYIAPFVELIHAVDSLSLLKEINKRAIQNNRIIKCLIQFHIAKESTKFGLVENEIDDFFSNISIFENVEICGVMGMTTFTENKQQVEQEFKNLKSIFNNIKTQYFKDKNYFKEISMGMSGDYKIAVKQGSTMIRIGSTIFGSR